MERIKGYIDRIVYRNEDNGYTVFELDVRGTVTVCVGCISAVDRGDMIEARGEYTFHKLYGKQFAVDEVVMCVPEDTASMERYLGSGIIKGIGPKLAAKIVTYFGEDTFRLIEEEPERLEEIKGISRRMARELGVRFHEKREMQNTMMEMQRLGISTGYMMKLYQQYRGDIGRILRENPYQIAADIPGIGFKTADRIAEKMGIHKDSQYRVKSAVLYILSRSVASGHVYITEHDLITYLRDILEIQNLDMENTLMALAIEKEIIVKSGDHSGEIRIYLPSLYYMEMRTAKKMWDLNLEYGINDRDIEKRLDRTCKREKITLDDMQRMAIGEALKYGVTVLSGGPGTGKTTTMNVLLRIFEEYGIDFLLAAPTGRAARRMTETTGYESKTIHRLLEVQGGAGDRGETEFYRNEDHPLEADAVIIDEMSMVDLPLFHALLRAIVPGTRLILLGDVNQLPSVGPGKVLEDIINSGKYKVVILTKIFRQAEKSDIVVNAHKINRGESIRLDNRSKDFFFMRRGDAKSIQNVIAKLVSEQLPGYVNARPYDIQVLTPMRKGVMGVENLNKILQEVLNPPGKNKIEKEYGEITFREGDKVMQIRNNYQLEWKILTGRGLEVDRGLGIFNGDMGIIRSINYFDENMIVEYEDKKRVAYPFSMLDEIEHAFAVTIHKSQGSEYPAIVIPLTSGPPQLYNRNLLYTGVTRAKKCVVLVGDENIFFQMIKNDKKRERHTSLAERIKDISNEYSKDIMA